MRLAPRILLAVVSLVVVAWLALGLRSAVLTERGQNQLLLALFQGSSPAVRRAKASQAESDLRRASSLNPDRLPRALQAQALAALGHKHQARALVEKTIAAEPDNTDILETGRIVGLLTRDPRLGAEFRRRSADLTPAGARP